MFSVAGRNMCCKVINYRGCVLYKNINKNFNTYYWSIVNLHLHPKDKPNGHPHCHSKSERTAKLIVDCFQALRTNRYWAVKKYPIPIRNKAMKLMNMPVWERN